MAEENNNKQQPKIKEPTLWWVTLIIYLVEIAIATGIFFSVLAIRNYFTEPHDQMTNYRYLADGFTVPGVLFIMIGFIIILSGQGAFDGVGYAIRRLGQFLLPFFFPKDITYADYLEQKRKRQRTVRFFSFMIVGIIFMIPAVIFIILFYKAM